MSESPRNPSNDFDGNCAPGACYIVYYSEPICWAYIYVEKEYEPELETLLKSEERLKELPGFVEVIEQGHGDRPPMEVQERLYYERGITPIDDIRPGIGERMRRMLDPDSPKR